MGCAMNRTPAHDNSRHKISLQCEDLVVSKRAVLMTASPGVMAASAATESIPIVCISQHTGLRTSAESGNFENGALSLVPGASWADSMTFASRFRSELEFSMPTFSLRHPYFIIVLCLFICALGITSIVRLARFDSFVRADGTHRMSGDLGAG